VFSKHFTGISNLIEYFAVEIQKYEVGLRGISNYKNPVIYILCQRVIFCGASQVASLRTMISGD
jgi:hypothetical protein